MTLTEIWTEERTPQLKAVKVTHWCGESGISANIDVNDILQTIAVLQRIEKDKKIQEMILKISKRGI